MATQWTAGTTSGQVLTAATLNTIGAAWENWTPVLTASTTNPTLGTGSSSTGKYGRVNKLIYGQGKITFGTAGINAGAGFYIVNLPITGSGVQEIIGSWWLGDVSANANYFGTLWKLTSTTAYMFFGNPAGIVSATNPFAWAVTDFISYQFLYEAA
jgi:hypothetical protein